MYGGRRLQRRCETMLCDCSPNGNLSLLLDKDNRSVVGFVCSDKVENDGDNEHSNEDH